MWLVWLENGDGGGDNDSLRYYVAITIPQIPLSKIDGVVNQFSARRPKERERDILVRVGGTVGRGNFIFAQNQIFAWAYHRPIWRLVRRD